MFRKNILIISALFLLMMPISTIHAENYKDLRKVIGDNTPEFIAKPIVFIVDKLEQFRLNAGIYSEAKKEKLEKEVSELPEAGIWSKVVKLLKYTELLFFVVAAFILHNRLMFYIVFFILVFLILRYIGRIFFL